MPEELSPMRGQIRDLWKVVREVEAKANLLADQKAAIVSHQILDVTRALDTNFVISPDREAVCFYCIQLQTTLLSSGTADIGVVFNVNGLERARIRHAVTLTLIGPLTHNSTDVKVLSAIVLAGRNVNLTTTGSGTGTATLLHSTEVLL